MKKILLLILPAIAGCLSSNVPPATDWLVELDKSAVTSEPAGKPLFGVSRLSYVAVRSPFDQRSFSVLREDGSIAFDAFNEFAATPSSLLKGAIYDSLSRSGKFKDVIGASSSAVASASIEVFVRRLCLDCREEDARKAVCEVVVSVIEGRDKITRAIGRGEADATDGNYGKAFSQAVSMALDLAISQLGN